MIYGENSLSEHAKIEAEMLDLLEKKMAREKLAQRQKGVAPLLQENEESQTLVRVQDEKNEAQKWLNLVPPKDSIFYNDYLIGNLWC